MEIRPITLKIAQEFVNSFHRHHSASVGCKFCIGLFDNDTLIGVAMCGRPVSRYLDDGFTLEINRLCTLGCRNACSMLYGASCRVAKAMGYKKVITYILQSELGSSLLASGFKFDGAAGAIHWSGCRDTGVNTPKELKKRFVKFL